jgi:hypothetical protein
MGIVYAVCIHSTALTNQCTIMQVSDQNYQIIKYPVSDYLQAHKLIQIYLWYTNTDCLVAFCTWILILITRSHKRPRRRPHRRRRRLRHRHLV